METFIAKLDDALVCCEKFSKEELQQSIDLLKCHTSSLISQLNIQKCEETDAAQVEDVQQKGQCSTEKTEGRNEEYAMSAASNTVSDEQVKDENVQFPVLLPSSATHSKSFSEGTTNSDEKVVYITLEKASEDTPLLQGTNSSLIAGSVRKSSRQSRPSVLLSDYDLTRRSSQKLNSPLKADGNGSKITVAVVGSETQMKVDDNNLKTHTSIRENQNEKNIGSDAKKWFISPVASEAGFKLQSVRVEEGMIIEVLGEDDKSSRHDSDASVCDTKVAIDKQRGGDTGSDIRTTLDDKTDCNDSGDIDQDTILSVQKVNQDDGYSSEMLHDNTTQTNSSIIPKKKKVPTATLR